MTNTRKHAERELDILVKSSPNPDNRPLIEPFIPELLALAEKFGNSGQSGGSAPYTASALANAVKSLCLQEPICPIAGLDEEWNHVALDEGKDLYQNNRCSSLFKKGKDGVPYYLDAITWRTDKNVGWSGNALLPHGNAFEKIKSRQFIKSFPFTPKTFIVDVAEIEVAKDDWEFHIKDESQLEEVFNYYQKEQI